MRPVWPIFFASTALLAQLIFVSGCRQSSTQVSATEPASPPWFIDATGQSGLNFVHEVGSVPLDQYFMPHLMGSGVAVFDFDNDGRLDLYFIQNGGPRSQARNRLFRQ